MRSWSRLGFLLVGVLALACPEVIRNKAAFSPAPSRDEPAIAVNERVRVVGLAGDEQTIPSNSRWRRVGSVDAGDVYQRVDGPFIVESQNAHEAYLVVKDGSVVGFYLPGEGAFAPAKRPVALPSP